MMQNHKFINLGTFYGKQESRCEIETIQSDYDDLLQVTHQFQIASEDIILIGDFNAHIGNDQEGIPNNKPEISRSGRLLRQFIKTSGLSIINKHPKCTGLWTRVHNVNASEMSILDYALASRSLLPSIESMIIDEEEHYRLSGISKTDHNSIFLNITLPWKKIKIPKPDAKWKINEQTDWQKISSALANCKEIESIFNNNDQPHTSYEQWIDGIKNIANNTIGTCTYKSQNKDPIMFDKKVKEERRRKRVARKDYEKAIKSRNPLIITEKRTKYIETQRSLQLTINNIN